MNIELIIILNVFSHIRNEIQILKHVWIKCKEDFKTTKNKIKDIVKFE